MEFNKEGTSTNKPPLLIGSNYAYWKVWMIVFLKSIDDDIWDCVEDGYSHPKLKLMGELFPNQHLNGPRRRSMPEILIVRLSMPSIMVSLLRSFEEFPLAPPLRKHGTFSKQSMRV